MGNVYWIGSIVASLNRCSGVQQFEWIRFVLTFTLGKSIAHPGQWHCNTKTPLYLYSYDCTDTARPLAATKNTVARFGGIMKAGSPNLSGIIVTLSREAAKGLSRKAEILRALRALRMTGPHPTKSRSATKTCKAKCKS
jgi:hypothetical protein